MSLSDSLTDSLSDSPSDRIATVLATRSSVAAYASRLHHHLHLEEGFPGRRFWFAEVSNSDRAAPRISRCSNVERRA
jgi:hypothetical protein